MMLQAQLITPSGRIVYYEDREIETPQEAAEFRRRFEQIASMRDLSVRLVSTCGSLAVKGDECEIAN